MWFNPNSPRKNLSIGLNTIDSLTRRSSESRMRGPLTSLHVVTRASGSTGRFEFTFTTERDPSDASAAEKDAFFDAVDATRKAYELTRLYRDVKLRGAIILNGSLTLLPGERLYSRVVAWNTAGGSGGPGSAGILTVTSYRIGWHADVSDNFNVSVPYLQIASVKLGADAPNASSSSARTLLVHIVQSSGGHVLGFQFGGSVNVDVVLREIAALHSAALVTPEFGVGNASLMQDADGSRFAGGSIVPSPTVAAGAPKVSAAAAAAQDHGDDGGYDDVDSEPAGESDAFAAYFCDGSGALAGGGACLGGAADGGARVVFSRDLGIAVEALPEGISIAQLWAVV